MFSRRLPASIEPNRISRALDAARGRPLIDLTESNPTAVGLAYPEAEILAALADPRALRYQPTPRGLDEARAAAAGWYARLGCAVDPARIWLTASTSEAYSLLFKLLCDPGDRVLVPAPSYPLFDLLAGLDAVATAPYPLRYQAGWYLDADEVARAVDARTRAILIVNPNNPTGSFVKTEQSAALEKLCAERGLALISDEVFADYARGPDPARAATLAGCERSLTFCLSGLSKPAGLPQLKLGWLHVGGPPELVAAAEARLELIADSYLSVGAPVQHAAARLIAAGAGIAAQLRARTERNRARLAAAVRGTALALLASEGGWYAVLRAPRTRTEEEWTLALLDDGVVVQPGFFFDFEEEAYLVVSLIVDEERFAEGVRRIVARAGE
jgi:aspartate/methionine/tyrosine aminotransferase